MSPVDGEFILYPHGRKPIYCAYENNNFFCVCFEIDYIMHYQICL